MDNSFNTFSLLSVTGGSFSGGKPDHSPTSTAEVKMRGAIPLLIQYVFMAWRLGKHRGKSPRHLLLSGRNIELWKFTGLEPVHNGDIF
jgi:hypothetical protein